MANRTEHKAEATRAAIYARVSDKSQAEDDKTSISEQIAEMEAHCQRRGLTIVARYQEVGRGWSKTRPEFQRMLSDARNGRFDTIVCWKSDRLSRGMYPAAALMEVVDTHQINLDAVMDSIDMKTFGLMAAIGKIELDNFRERSALGRRGAAKQGRIPANGVPYGYRIGDDGKPQIDEAEAAIVRRIFDLYVHQGLGAPSIARQLTEEDVPLAAKRGKRWHQPYIQRILKNEAYKGTWWYGKTRQVATDSGRKIYDQPRDTWIEIPFPPLVNDETWNQAQTIKARRMSWAKRNTKTFYLLQHLVRCAECGLLLGGRTTKRNVVRRHGKVYEYDLDPPRRYYKCYGMQTYRSHCRERPFIRAERLEDLIWSEVKQVIQNPDLIVAGMDSLSDQTNDNLAEQIAQAERDLRDVQMEEERAIRLYVSGKITEDQLDHQRKFITERLEHCRAKLDDFGARDSLEVEKRAVADTVAQWAREVGEGLDDTTPEQRREILQLVLDRATLDRDNVIRITLAIPSPEPELVAIAEQASSHLAPTRTRYATHPTTTLASHPTQGRP